MLQSTEQKVNERLKPFSVQPVRDRFHMRWDCIGNYAQTDDFSQVVFRLNMPDSETTLHGLRVVLPLQFAFRDKSGQLIDHAGIAKKVWPNNIFESVTFRCNGVSLTQRPEENKHHEACWELADELAYQVRDEGSLLPIVNAENFHHTDLANKGFASRARQFRDLREYAVSTNDERVGKSNAEGAVAQKVEGDANATATPDTYSSTHNMKEQGFYYTDNVEIIPDLAMFQAFRKKAFEAKIDDAAYIFELDLILTFRKDIESNRNQDTVAGYYGDDTPAYSHADISIDVPGSSYQNSIWRELFRIQNPIVESVLQDADFHTSGQSEYLEVEDTCFLAVDYQEVPSGEVVSQSHLLIANADATHTDIVWNVAQMGAALPEVGDILGMKGPGNNQWNLTWKKHNEGETWVRVLGTTPNAGAGTVTIEHADIVHADYRWAGGANTDLREIKWFPRLKIRNFNTHCRNWLVGDRLVIHTAKTFYSHNVGGFTNEDGNTRVGAIWLAHPWEVFWKAQTEIKNVWAQYGPFSIPCMEQDAVDAEGNILDRNNQPDVDQNPMAAFAHVGEQRTIGAVAEVQAARLNVLPNNFSLQDGDVIKIQAGNINTCNLNGYFRVIKKEKTDRSALIQQNRLLGQYSESTGIFIDLVRYADGDFTRHRDTSDPTTRSRDLMKPLEAAPDELAHRRDDVEYYSQRNHLGGRCKITKINTAVPTSIASITAMWTKNPFVRAECIKNDPSSLKQEYIFPYQENEYYNEPVRVRCFDCTSEIDGVLQLSLFHQNGFGGIGAGNDAQNFFRAKPISIKMNGIRLLSGFSSLHVYCTLDPVLSRRLEMYCSLGDLLFDVKIKNLRLNSKYCIRNQTDEIPETWFYEQHKRITESTDTFVQWKDKRMVISLDPESLALPSFYENASRLYNMDLDIEVDYSKSWENAVRNSLTVPSTLCTGKHFGFRNPKSTFEFMNDLNVSCRVVIDYRKKAIRIDEGGDLQIMKMLTQTSQPDGLTLPGKPVQNILHSGGDATFDVRNF